MNVGNKSTLLAEVDRLIALELYESAEALATLYLSQLTTVEFKPKTTNEPISITFADVYEKLADVLYKKTETKRALQYYRSASQRRKTLVKVRSQLVATAEEARLRYKECKCLIDLRDSSTVIRDLEAIPVNLRDEKIHLLLGQQYLRNNRKRDAIKSLKVALNAAPLSVEIIEQLINLGVDAAEILATLDESFRHKENSTLVADGWLHTLVTALVNKRNAECDKSLAHLTKLATVYPKNTYLSALQTEVLIENDQIDQGMVLYRQVRRDEPYLVHRTPTYGHLLSLKEDNFELARLTESVLDTAPKCPEGWMLAGMHAAVKGEGEAALTLVDKAIQMDTSRSEGYRIRGQILLAQENADQALIAFLQANNLQKDLASFTGLVKCHLALGKVRDASACAREAVALYPRSSVAHTLMGSVFAQTPSGAGECLSSYTKALQLNPQSKTAAIALAEVLIAAGKPQEAVNCLETILKKVSCHKLRLALGKAYAAAGQYRTSVEQLHTAISLNHKHETPTSEAAVEFERVEGLIKGEGEEDEEGDGEECEVDGDQQQQQQQRQQYYVPESPPSGAGEYAGGHSLIDEEADTAASLALSQYYHAAGLAAEEADMSNSLNPRDFTAYADEGQDEGELEMSYYQDEHSGDVDRGLVYGSLDNSEEG